MRDETGHRCLGPDLLWRNLRAGPAPFRRGALFVDRDGVLVEEKVYLSDPAQVKLIPGAVELLRAAMAWHIPVIQVTNQAGIARGKFGWAEFSAVEDRVEDLLMAEGVRVDAVFACPFHAAGRGAYRVDDHPWRKPNPGMLAEAASLLNLDLAGSLLVGDKASDILAARNAGLHLAVHVLTGHGRDNASASSALASHLFDVVVASDPSEATPHLRAVATPNSAR